MAMEATDRRYVEPWVRAASERGRDAANEAPSTPLTAFRPKLHALSYLDVENKAASDDETFRSSRSDGSQRPPAKRPASPDHYSSRANHAADQLPAWSLGRSDARHPPDLRNASGEELESIKRAFRQSLPSITEALKPLPPAEPHHQHQSARATSAAPPSPSSTRHAFGLGPHNPYSKAASYQPQKRQDSYATPATHPSDPSRSPFPPVPESRRLASPPPPKSQQLPPAPLPPPPPSAPYGYTYPSRQAPPATPAAGPVYQPSAQYGAPPLPSPDSWKADGAPRRYSLDDRPPAYGDSIKRHLEMYDLGAALSEINSVSQALSDFSRRYGEHLHQNSRGAPPLHMMPGLVELDDMIGKSRSQLDALARIRDVVVAEQAAYEQRLVDQRVSQANAAGDGAMPPPPQPLDRVLVDDAVGGFANGNSKKARGRTAPPGRCHSCNRAETPEWRRGPDGARTLCNACGLHYAKLTRKQAGASKAAAAASGASTLRPKE